VENRETFAWIMVVFLAMMLGVAGLMCQDYLNDLQKAKSTLCREHGYDEYEPTLDRCMYVPENFDTQVGDCREPCIMRGSLRRTSDAGAW
jgi:hypothetical protein